MAREKNEKMWMAGGAVSAVVLAAALWAFVVSPEMSDSDSLRSKTADAQTENFALQSNVSRLRNQYDHIEVTKRQLADVQAQLPSDSGLSALTTQLNLQASSHHVTITQLTAAAPTPWTSPTPTGAVPAAASSTPAAAAATTTGSPAGQLYVIPVSVAVTGKQSDELAFAQAVQREGPRSALVGQVNLQNGGGAGATGSGTSGSSLTLQMNVFVAPVAPTVPATPGTPASTPTASPTPTG